MAAVLESSFETRCFASLLRTRFRVSDRAQFPRPEEPAERASRRTAASAQLGVVALALASVPLRPRRPDRRSHQVLPASSAAAASRVRVSSASRPTGGRPPAFISIFAARSARRCSGREGKIEFHPYDSDNAFERVENGADDLFFLDGSDIADHRLAGKIALGPAVYFVSTAAMVHGDSADPALERSRRQIDLLLPGRQRPSASGRLDGGAAPELRPHGLHGIRRAS